MWERPRIAHSLGGRFSLPLPPGMMEGDHRWLNSPAARTEILKAFAEQLRRAEALSSQLQGCISPSVAKSPHFGDCLEVTLCLGSAEAHKVSVSLEKAVVAA